MNSTCSLLNFQHIINIYSNLSLFEIVASYLYASGMAWKLSFHSCREFQQICTTQRTKKKKQRKWNQITSKKQNRANSWVVKLISIVRCQLQCSAGKCLCHIFQSISFVRVFSLLLLANQHFHLQQGNISVRTHGCVCVLWYLELGWADSEIFVRTKT